LDIIVLAGGFARRMWPLTRDRPKHLLIVGGKPMLEHVTDRVEALPKEWVDRAFLSTNEAFAGEFREFLSGKKWNHRWDLAVESAQSEGEKKGSLGALGEIIRDRDIFGELMVVGGDNLFGFDLAELVTLGRERGGSALAVYDVGDRELARLYGIVDVGEDGRMRGLVEKPDNPPSTLASTACFYLASDGVKSLLEYLDSGGNTDALGNFWHWFIPRKPAYAHTFEGIWFDIGSFESYDEANAHFGTPTNTVGEYGGR
jgi:glucose-1-phosphate thymidylyltransferase